MKRAPGSGLRNQTTGVAAAWGGSSEEEGLARALGSYLSSRPDLVPIEDCLALARTAASGGTPLPSAALRRLFADEIGDVPEALFDSFDDQPYRVGHLFQWHAARLAGGRRVTVKIRHSLPPSARAAAVFARRALRRWEPLAGQADRLANAFERRLSLTADLAAEGRALAELSEEVDRPGWLSVPEFFAQLSSGRILTREHLGGVLPAPASDGSARDAARARRLSKAWLHLVLAGSPFPLEPAADSMVFLASGGVAFLEGPFGRASDAEREALFGYLTAVAGEEHERAAEFLLDRSRESSRELEAGLRHRLRHVAPFRDGAWLEDGDRLAQDVLAQWRLATGLGLCLKPGMVEFFTGFFRLTEVVRRLAPRSNGVATGFQELRLQRIATRMRRLLAEEGGFELVQRQLQAMLELPPKLDRLLDLAVREGSLRRRSQGRKEPPPRRRPAVLASLLVVLATTALVVGRFADSLWAQGVGALVVLVIGGLFLLVARRGG